MSADLFFLLYYRRKKTQLFLTEDLLLISRRRLAFFLSVCLIEKFFVWKLFMCRKFSPSMALTLFIHSSFFPSHHIIILLMRTDAVRFVLTENNLIIIGRDGKRRSTNDIRYTHRSHWCILMELIQLVFFFSFFFLPAREKEIRTGRFVLYCKHKWELAANWFLKTYLRLSCTLFTS